MGRTVYTPGEALNVAAYITDEKPLWSTGFRSVDRRIFGIGMQQGIPRGDHCVIGGASHAGKTVFALDQAYKAALSGEIAAVFSLEQDSMDLAQRMLQAKSEIPAREWRPDRWTETHTLKLRDEAMRVGLELGAAGVVIYGDEHFAGELDQMHVILDAMLEAVDNGCTWLMVDHAQLIDVPGLNDYEATKLVNKEIRKLARREGVTTVLLSQLNRDTADDMTRSPRMSGLLGGTSLESNADHIFLLDHSLTRRVVTDEAKSRTWLIHAKNRRGPSGYSIPVEVDWSNLAWREARQDEEYLWASHEEK